MKNLIFTLFIATVLFSSCSKEESVANTTIPPVGSIKRISETTFYNGTARTYGADFNYENDQLKSLNVGSIGSFELVMEGNKIVQTKSIVNNAVSDANNITYEGNNLKLIQQGAGSEKTEYNYINGRLASEPSSYSTNVGPFVLSTLNSYTFNSNQNIANKILYFYQGIN